MLAGRADYAAAVPRGPAGGARPALRAAQRGGPHRAPALFQRPAPAPAPLRLQPATAAVRARDRRASPRAPPWTAPRWPPAVPVAGVTGGPGPAHGPVRPLRPARDSATWPSTRSAGPIPRLVARLAGGRARGARSSTPATTRPACSRAGWRGATSPPSASTSRSGRSRSARCSSGSSRRASRGTSASTAGSRATPTGPTSSAASSRPPCPGLSLPGYVPDPALERRIRAATRLPDAARARAIAEIDADLSRSAAAVPFATTRHHRLLLRPHRLPGPPADLRHLARRAVRPALTRDACGRVRDPWRRAGSPP